MTTDHISDWLAIIWWLLMGVIQIVLLAAVIVVGSLWLAVSIKLLWSCVTS